MLTITLLFASAALTAPADVCASLHARWDRTEQTMVEQYQYYDRDAVNYRKTAGELRSSNYRLLAQRAEERRDRLVEEKMLEGDRILALIVANKCAPPARPMSKLTPLRSPPARLASPISE